MPQTKQVERPRKERARFAALLHQDGLPLKITVKRQREVYDAETGRKQTVAGSGVYIDFVDEGDGIQAYETSDPDEIQLLRTRANEFGVFSEVPFAVPDSRPTLRQVSALAVRRDKNALVALALEEEDTHQRDDVLEAIADALEVLEG